MGKRGREEQILCPLWVVNVFFMGSLWWECTVLASSSSEGGGPGCTTEEKPAALPHASSYLPLDTFPGCLCSDRAWSKSSWSHRCSSSRFSFEEHRPLCGCGVSAQPGWLLVHFLPLCCSWGTCVPGMLLSLLKLQTGTDMGASCTCSHAQEAEAWVIWLL